MKVENRLRIFEFLKDSSRVTGQAVGDLFLIFSLPYGTSLGRMQYLLKRKHYKEELQNTRKKKRRFDDLLYHLKKDNLVSNTIKGGKSFLKLTRNGKEYLEKLRLIKSNILPNNRYHKKDENLFKIVIFDVPEREKRKRAWLRAALKNLDFTMLQKSVWIGRVKLPREFISAIDDLDLSSHVEIFAISKTGSLKQLNI